ncbi:hypothetical protein IFM89_028998 [Coptis chinensis]|uniref:Transmembrane protein n=1 Tax=Coptis chinensis TaxID=261450 RepID=A0A835M4L6_9MAGN|nr:hypothetical protein IFM89_028998 [Coptis chinensis]
MAFASSQQSFLTNALISSLKPKYTNLNTSTKILCQSPGKKDNGSSSKRELQLAKLAMVTLAAGVLTLGSVDGALAAKSAGRVGGQAFRPSAPRPSAPRYNNSRTNIYVNPPVAPPLVGGYGYGYGVPYGGWGWSPFSFFAPGPSVAVGVGGGFELLPLFIFFGVAAAVFRRFGGSRDDEDDDY